MPFSDVLNASACLYHSPALLKLPIVPSPFASKNVNNIDGKTVYLLLMAKSLVHICVCGESVPAVDYLDYNSKERFVVDRDYFQIYICNYPNVNKYTHENVHRIYTL